MKDERWIEGGRWKVKHERSGNKIEGSEALKKMGLIVVGGNKS